MNNKKTNKNKKKLFILFLLLFVVIGLTGYGAYSYFYTSGSYSGHDEIDIASFNPEVDGDFLGDGGTLTLTCPSSETGNETVYCTGTLEVTNNGSTSVDITISNVETNINPLSHDDVSSSLGTTDFSWNNSSSSSTSIGAGSSDTLTVTVPVNLSSNFGDSSGHERDESYTGEAIEVTVSFKLTATQAQGY